MSAGIDNEQLIDELLGMCAVYGPNSRQVYNFVQCHKFRKGWWKEAKQIVSRHFGHEYFNWGTEPVETTSIEIFVMLAVMAIFFLAVLLACKH